MIYMPASPELRRPTTPEFVLRPIATLRSVEDHGKVQSLSSEEGEEECHTPTSVESKIPAISSCPPAPRKTRRVVVLCRRRRLSELELFKVGPEEIECLFRRRQDSLSKPSPTVSPTNKKRKRRCTNEE